MLASAASVAGETPLRVDTRELDISCDAGDSVAATEWTDAGGRHLRLLLSGVTEEEAASLELSVTVSERFYCLWGRTAVRPFRAQRGDAPFPRSAPRSTTSTDDAGNCVRFAPGNMLEAYDWRQDAAVELSWAIEGMDADAHIALYRLDAISESADGMVILEVRTPANANHFPGSWRRAPASAWARAPRARNLSTPPSFQTSRPRLCLKTRRCWVLQKRPWSTPIDIASHAKSRPRHGGGSLFTPSSAFCTPSARASAPSPPARRAGRRGRGRC